MQKAAACIGSTEQETTDQAKQYGNMVPHNLACMMPTGLSIRQPSRGLGRRGLEQLRPELSAFRLCAEEQGWLHH